MPNEPIRYVISFAMTIMVRPFGHSGVFIRIRHAMIPQSFSAGERVRVTRPHCLILPLISS